LSIAVESLSRMRASAPQPLLRLLPIPEHLDCLVSLRAHCEHPRQTEEYKRCQPTSGLAPFDQLDIEGLCGGDVSSYYDLTGTIMCAYGVPFHITHGTPPPGLPGSEVSVAEFGAATMMCGPAVTQSFGFLLASA